MLYRFFFSFKKSRSSRQWWTREKIAEYLPIVSKDYAPIVNYLKKIKILGKNDIPITNEWLKAVLDYLRFWVTRVEPSILLLSVFSAGCAIIATKR